MYIYIFKNIDEREEKTGQLSRLSFNNKLDESITNSNVSKNVVIVLEFPFGKKDTFQYNEFQEIMEPLAEMRDFVSNIVFHDLNDGKTLVYTGKSEHWRGSYTINYYNNPIRDEDENLQMDSWSRSWGEIVYTGESMGNVGRVSYEHNTGGGETVLDSDGVISIGGNEGSGYSLLDEIEYRVSWNDQQETLILKPEADVEN